MSSQDARDSNLVRRGLVVWLFIGIFVFMIRTRGVNNSNVDNRGPQERYYERHLDKGKVGPQFGKDTAISHILFEILILLAKPP